MIFNFLVLTTSALLILSKFMDCYTTIKYVKNLNAETNQIAKMLMIKFGFKSTIWALFLFVLIVTLVYTFMVLNLNNLILTIGFILLGSLISVFQFSVAKYNKTKKHNIFTKWVLKWAWHKKK
jgi:L-asparagine transporter-like permease